MLLVFLELMKAYGVFSSVFVMKIYNIGANTLFVEYNRPSIACI